MNRSILILTTCLFLGFTACPGPEPLPSSPPDAGDVDAGVPPEPAPPTYTRALELGIPTSGKVGNVFMADSMLPERPASKGHAAGNFAIYACLLGTDPKPMTLTFNTYKASETYSITKPCTNTWGERGEDTQIVGPAWKKFILVEDFYFANQRIELYNTGAAGQRFNLELVLLEWSITPPIITP